MLEEVKYCKNIMKTIFNKKLVMTKEDEENFKKGYKMNVIFVIKNILKKVL